ncbi:M48 family metalloprotease [Ramlibacter sp. USB13]|uniref:M48 family metalloprotease n=1 Tax=Ramlibacter cellulosilyticus TaxID=2764187 RepID=A0A923MQK7_9BURK|nr:M48 family metallopeptidase [Ramlibacter cellulosilyticus]MBC5783390.1 M48 family metalloprotease [Ramlibacter cellulosilyticus]
MNRFPRTRRFLRSACTRGVAVATLVVLPALAQDLSAIKVPPRFTRPAADTDEGGLWGLMDREEARLKRSPLTIRDKELQAYLQDLVCRVSEGHCPDIRVTPVRTPHFNAMMAPNGMMIVWSGLLLRVENEAQLAAILGHELGHYLERHTVEQLRAQKDTAVLSTMVGMIGGVGTFLGQIGLAANLMAFSREHEVRADRMGMRLMRLAGYDGREAAAVWSNLLEELKVTGGKDAGKHGDIFDTHPVTAGRRDELRQLAGDAGGIIGEERYRQVIAPMRLGWLQDEVKRGQYEESLVLFGRMLRKDAKDAQVLFARGEVYRLRDEGGDAERALADLNLASGLDKAPAETFRSLGLLYRQRSDKAAAADAFKTYLARAPQAADAAMVRSYLEEVQ